jgi:Ca-activated chloride channel family protein
MLMKGSIRMMPLRRLAAAALLALSASAAHAAERTIIVLDASGSMWGQIDGKPKLEIAREALSALLPTIPAETELGFMAYGHRQKGVCSDIELIVEPAPGTGPAIAEAAARMRFLGMTPLTESVRRAAEALRHTEEKATVVLITDGIETCNADPCALGRELAETGVDFTAHVVGFGLSEEEGRQVACLAENTGGQYIQAGDADALSEALTRTIVAVATEADVDFVAIDQDGTRLSVPLRFIVSGPDGADALTLEGEGRASTELEPGDYRVLVEGTDIAGGTEFTVAEPPVALEVEVPVEVTVARASLDAPETAEIASTVEVAWEGPAGNRDDLQLYDPAARGGAGEVVRSLRLNQDRLFDERKARLVMAARPGRYELRYWQGERRAVLASRPIELVEADVSLDAPDSVPIGARVTIAWTGPAGRSDDVQIFDPAARGGDGTVVRSQRLNQDGGFDERTVTMVAPATAGSYELRYWNGENRRVLATRPLEVVDAEVSLDAADTVSAGSTFSVDWVGPAGSRDDIHIFDPSARGGEGAVARSQRLNQDRGFEDRKVSLVAPTRPGDYVLRYWNGADSRVLAERPIVVAETQTAIEAPETVEMGKSFTIGWVGPGAARDDAQIVRAGDDRVLRSQRLRQDKGFEDGKATLVAPIRPGAYELRYWNGEDRRLLATRAFEVVEIPVSLEGPSRVGAEERFTVRWQGPGAARDDLQIVSTATDKTARTQRLRQDKGFEDGEVTIQAPKEPGSYELRYYNGEDRAVLVTAPLTVQ